MIPHEIGKIMRILDMVLQNIPLRFNYINLVDKKQI